MKKNICAQTIMFMFIMGISTAARAQEAPPQIFIKAHLKEKARIENELFDMKEQQRQQQQKIKDLTQKIDEQSQRMRFLTQDLKYKAQQSRIVAVESQDRVRTFSGVQSTVGPKEDLQSKTRELAVRSRDMAEKAREARERAEMAIQRQKDFIGRRNR